MIQNFFHKFHFLPLSSWFWKEQDPNLVLFRKRLVKGVSDYVSFKQGKNIPWIMFMILSHVTKDWNHVYSRQKVGRK